MRVKPYRGAAASADLPEILGSPGVQPSVWSIEDWRRFRLPDVDAMIRIELRGD
jgi:hypothetical protein